MAIFIHLGKRPNVWRGLSDIIKNKGSMILEEDRPNVALGESKIEMITAGVSKPYAVTRLFPGQKFIGEFTHEELEAEYNHGWVPIVLKAELLR